MTEARPSESPRMRRIGGGAGWSASEFVCDAGPSDPPFEERHVGASVAFVLSGSFRYRTQAGDSLLFPGAFLLGSSGRCYQCGHEHGRGDRCVSFNYDDDYFEEIAHAATGSLRFAFPRPALPPCQRLLPLGARMAACGREDALALDELAAQIALTAARVASGEPALRRSPIADRDRARIAPALEALTRASAKSWTLERLARRAGLSKFHMLRLFARVTGLTPYRYLLSVRLQRAATALVVGKAPISVVAFEEGFGDLSTFNAQFKSALGAAPSRWRKSQS